MGIFSFAYFILFLAYLFLAVDLLFFWFFSLFFSFVSVKWLFAWFRLLYAEEEICNCYGLNNKLHSYTFILFPFFFFLFFFFCFPFISFIWIIICKAAEIILTSWIKGLNICVNLSFFSFLMMKTKTDLQNVQENICSWKYNYCFHLSIRFNWR